MLKTFLLFYTIGCPVCPNKFWKIRTKKPSNWKDELSFCDFDKYLGHPVHCTQAPNESLCCLRDLLWDWIGLAGRQLSLLAALCKVDKLQELDFSAYLYQVFCSFWKKTVYKSTRRSNNTLSWHSAWMAWMAWIPKK